MSRDYFVAQYQDYSTLALLFIALNEQGDYCDEASEVATMIVRSRFKHTSDLEQLLKEEIERRLYASKCCNICGSAEVQYSIDHKLYGETRFDIKRHPAQSFKKRC
jgi:hypothetical protein